MRTRSYRIGGGSTLRFTSGWMYSDGSLDIGTGSPWGSQDGRLELIGPQTRADSPNGWVFLGSEHLDHPGVPGGLGTLLIADGAQMKTVNMYAGDNGTAEITVTGAGSSLRSLIFLGSNGGTGTVTVADGAEFSGNITGGIGCCPSALELRGDGAEFSGEITGGSPPTATVAFDGGILDSGYDVELTNVAVIVKAGGMTIDNHGRDPPVLPHNQAYDVHIASNLLHDPALGVAPDGGLTVTGGGGVVLDGPANSYTGNTTVEDGTLQINMPFLDPASTVSINAGASLLLNYSGTNEIAGLIAGGVALAPGLYNAGNQPGFLTGGGSLTVAAPGLPGDYNDDGMVDAADYVVWRKNGGTQQQYDDWRANFGRTAGSGSSSQTAVPEPASLALLLSGALVICSCRRKARTASSGRWSTAASCGRRIVS